MSANLKYQHPGVQFAVLLGLAVGMFLLSGVITATFFGDVAEALSSGQPQISDEALKQFKWAQLIAAIISFIIPALVFAYLCDERPLRYVGLTNRVQIFILFMVMILLVAVQPFALYLGQLNQKVDFGSMQEEIKRAEAFYEKAMTNFTRMKSGTDLMVNLVIVGLLPALGEELFFRGSLQNVLERWIKKPWIAIVLSSFMFALLHGTLFKLVPIFVLGLVLGTLFYITRNLWYCVLFHFLNNSLALVATYYATTNETLKKLSQEDYKISLLSAGISLIVTVALFIAIRRRSPYKPLLIPNQEERWH